MVEVAASGDIRRTALAVSLCLLAFVFAVEAKLAWFNVPIGQGIDVASAKALPAELPQMVAHGTSAPHRAFSAKLPLMPALTATAGMGAAELARRCRAALDRHGSSSATSFTPHLFFRPPPRS